LMVAASLRDARPVAWVATHAPGSINTRFGVTE
jgi:hypothetical protein